MGSVLSKLDEAFQPGLSTVTWTSMQIPEFCENLHEVMDNTQDFIKEVTTSVISCIELT
jgi:hypothetical protein